MFLSKALCLLIYVAILSPGAAAKCGLVCQHMESYGNPRLEVISGTDFTCTYRKLPLSANEIYTCVYDGSSVHLADNAPGDASKLCKPLNVIGDCAGVHQRRQLDAVAGEVTTIAGIVSTVEGLAPIGLRRQLALDAVEDNTRDPRDPDGALESTLTAVSKLDAEKRQLLGGLPIIGGLLGSLGGGSGVPSVPQEETVAGAGAESNTGTDAPELVSRRRLQKKRQLGSGEGGGLSGVEGAINEVSGSLGGVGGAVGGVEGAVGGVTGTLGSVAGSSGLPLARDVAQEDASHAPATKSKVVESVVRAREYF